MKSQAKKLRQESIVAELRASPAIRIAELAIKNSVSTETIRRDLDELSAEGLINRTYGGATGAPFASEPLLDDRYRANVNQRTAMAKATALLVNNGDSLMIDAGATTIYVARRLAAELTDVTVITNSFGVATALAANLRYAYSCVRANTVQVTVASPAGDTSLYSHLQRRHDDHWCQSARCRRAQ
jgi:DeoR/GlpR family transcriptional regulator of sugar metabolism